MDIDYPLHFDRQGRTARTGREEHIRDLIEQLLFTNAGERVNRPDFGSGLLDLVFAPNSPELAGGLEVSIKAPLQSWLGDLIDIEAVEVQSEGGVLRVAVQYVVKATGNRRTDLLERPGL
jgi:phage baseplate assembly protein W